MSHRDPTSGSALAPRHFAILVLALVPLSFWSCDSQDSTNLDNVGGSGGSGGSTGGSGGSGGTTMAGSGGSAGATGGSGGSAGSGATGGSSGSAGAGATGGGTSSDPDGGVDAAVPDGGGNGSTFNCTSGDSACALCEVWTQLVDCQPTATCPDEQRTAMDGFDCAAQYAAYLDCYAAEPVTSSVCAPNPSTRLADARLGGTGTENNCQAQECALYSCIGAFDPPSCP